MTTEVSTYRVQASLTLPPRAQFQSSPMLNVRGDDVNEFLAVMEGLRESKDPVVVAFLAIYGTEEISLEDAAAAMKRAFGDKGQVMESVAAQDPTPVAAGAGPGPAPVATGGGATVPGTVIGPCPKCGDAENGQVVIKQGGRGPFKACNRFPKCDYVLRKGGGK